MTAATARLPYAVADSPGLGRPPAADQPSDLVVLFDGSGLPAGRGTVRQGREVYENRCLACHGPEGRGGINDQLAGGELPDIKSIGSFWPYATSVFDYVRRAMPYASPGSLSNEDVYSVVGYLLYLNGLLSADANVNSRVLVDIKMPNRNGFFSRYPIPE